MKRTAIKRKTPIRKVSAKQAERLAKYAKTEPMGPKGRCCFPGCSNRNGILDRHHPYSRRGDHLFRFIILCRFHHDLIHQDPSGSMKEGWLQNEWRGMPPDPNAKTPWLH